MFKCLLQTKEMNLDMKYVKYHKFSEFAIRFDILQIVFESYKNNYGI